MPLQNNALIEELLGEHGVICVEDIIDVLMKCGDEEMPFSEVQKVIWPIQLISLKEDSSKGNTKHEATRKEIKKINTKISKGGYLG